MTSAKTTLGKGSWPSVPPVKTAETPPKSKPAAPPAAPEKRKPPKVYESIRIEELSLCDDALPEGRAKPGSKYDALFSDAVKTGKTIKTPGGAAASVSNLARTWLKRNGHPNKTTRSVGNYGDGLGRVWIINETPAAKTGKKGCAA